MLNYNLSCFEGNFTHFLPSHWKALMPFPTLTVRSFLVTSNHPSGSAEIVFGRMREQKAIKHMPAQTYPTKHSATDATEAKSIRSLIQSDRYISHTTSTSLIYLLYIVINIMQLFRRSGGSDEDEHSKNSITELPHSPPSLLIRCLTIACPRIHLSP